MGLLEGFNHSRRKALQVLLAAVFCRRGPLSDVYAPKSLPEHILVLLAAVVESGASLFSRRRFATMTSGLPNSHREPGADAAASKAEQKAVETFTIDVSAGHQTAATSRRKRRAKKAGADRTLPEAKGPVGAKRNRAAPTAGPHFSSERASQRSLDPDASAPEPTSRGGTPSWLVSLAVHAVILLLLSFFSLASLQQEDFGLWASTAPQEVVDEFVEIEIDPSVDFESLDTELPTELEDPGTASFGDLSAESELSDLSHSTMLAGDNLGEWGSLFGESGSGLGDLGEGAGGAMTSFFGTQARAGRIVFVIDNTGSMNYGGLETVIVELLKSVDSMSPRQQFYVLFFSDQVYPLFHPRSQTNFVRATEENKQMLRRWLDTVEICTGGVWQLTQSLTLAYELKPDVVYLLCDGRDWDLVRASYKVEAVRLLRTTANPLGIPVHTLGMGCKTDGDRENLATVARVNFGTFREVEVTPALVEIARQRNRPYHNKGPGEVWGTEVLNRKTLGE